MVSYLSSLHPLLPIVREDPSGRTSVGDPLLLLSIPRREPTPYRKEGPTTQSRLAWKETYGVKPSRISNNEDPIWSLLYHTLTVPSRPGTEVTDLLPQS